MDLSEEVNRELAKSHSIFEVKSELIKRGYLESDIDKVLNRHLSQKSEKTTKNNKILSIKELFDRIGYGFASSQFVNILFMLSGASFFLIGFMNGVKTALTYLSSGFLSEYSKARYIGKRFISASGIIFGFSFLGMAIAVALMNPVLFAVSLIVGSLGIIAHGDLYVEFYNKILKNERRREFLKFVSYFGIIITAVSLLVAGFIIEMMPIGGQPLSLDLSVIGLSVWNIKLFGYLLTFEVTAIMFILSGYLLSFLEDASESMDRIQGSAVNSLNNYMSNSVNSMKLFVKNKKIFILSASAILMTICQVVGNSFYGIFIYQNFKFQFFHGFMNVAVIFVIAVIASISGTLLTKKFSKSLGEAPMLVFGTLLVALMPITFYFNPHLYAIGLSTALSVIGGAIVGVAQGLIAERLMDEEELKTYYSTFGFVSVLPTIILVGIGALYAQIAGLPSLFLIIGLILALLIMPLYFVLVLIVDAEYRKEKNMQRNAHAH